jgi:membrane protease YdiL (CAAX protease family)
MNNIRWQVLGYTVIGLIAGALVGLNQLRMMPVEQVNAMLAQVGSPMALALIAGVQSAVLVVVSSILGLRMAARVGFNTAIVVDTRGVRTAVVIAIVLGVVIVGSDMWVFAPYLPPNIDVPFSWLGLLSSVLYGGIVEEILLRLFVMTLIVWLMSKVLGLFGVPHTLPTWVFWWAIVLSSLLFAAGHLPVTFSMLCPVDGDCTPLIVRAFLLNGIGGLGFGYLYWRHGLMSAMVSHMATHVVMQGLLVVV